MKRNATSTAASSAVGEGGNAYKKQKLIADSEVVSSAEDLKDERTKEQRRKDKKVSKILAKIEVSSLFYFLFKIVCFLYDTSSEANPPKFFYSASELSKRREP